MIIIPIFMPRPSVGYASMSKEDRERIQNNRNDVLAALQNTSGLTIQDIAVKTKKDVRQVNAILTVLKRDNRVESEYTENGKLWRLK